MRYAENDNIFHCKVEVQLTKNKLTYEKDAIYFNLVNIRIGYFSSEGTNTKKQ